MRESIAHVSFFPHVHESAAGIAVLCVALAIVILGYAIQFSWEVGRVREFDWFAMMERQVMD